MICKLGFLLLFQIHSVVAVDKYASYRPTTVVSDLAALDLDQFAMNSQLSARNMSHAMHIYREGGHSGSYAILTLTNLGSEGVSYPANTQVIGKNGAAQEVLGILKTDTAWGTNTVEQEIEVHYLDSNQEDNLCRVGGFWRFHEAQRFGCYTDSGTVRLVPPGDDEGVEYSYEYDTRMSNQNSITLQGLSTKASTTMRGPGGSYWNEFQLFTEYYGDKDYADKWISAASKKTNTDYSSGRGNSDFSVFQDRHGQAEALKKGAAYLNVWMEVVRHLNEAVERCQRNMEGAERELDEAVALYTGSLTKDLDEPGILLYGLAQVRAHQFRTAGHQGDKDYGDAYVNVQVIQSFKRLQGFLINTESTELCKSADETVREIINLMKVPLIQGTLRYAYIRDRETPANEEAKERSEAEAATFAAAILPFVHKCGSREAKEIHDNLKIGAKTSFSTVKRALERKYKCMGVTCEQVGGVWDRDDEVYKQDGAPCGGIETSSTSGAAVFGRFVGIMTGLALIGYILVKYRHNIARAARRARSYKQAPVVQMHTGNIAAVTEIA